MFGYFRYPDIQTSDDHGCPDLNSTPLPPQVILFRRELDRMRIAGQQLVAMGDNFAPELLARSMQNNLPGTEHAGELVSKDLFAPGEQGDRWLPATQESNGGKIPADNVGCFLRLMGFNAIVPGQQDFYYGPERLRQVARFLAEPPDSNYKPVQMLAANLVIRSTRRNALPPKPNDTLPLPVQRALDGDSPVRFALPASVFPWLQDVPLSGKAERVTVYDCPADSANPRNFALPSDESGECRRLQKSAGEPVRFRLRPPPNPSENFLPGYYTLDPGSNHALCATYLQDGNVKTHCQLFSVQYPFLQYHPKATGVTPAPYFVPPDPDGPVTFGVLDSSLVG